jgi:hypothetical protein
VCCIAEIAMLIFGIIALSVGRFTLWRDRVVQGTPARIVGGLLLLPLLVGQGGAAIIGAMWGMEREMQGRPLDFQNAFREVPQELQTKVTILNIVAVAVPFVAVLVISLVTAKPPKRKKRRRDWDDEDDDYDRNDDRPRRRRREREAYDEDDDRPRRRRDRYDSEDED